MHAATQAPSAAYQHSLQDPRVDMAQVSWKWTELSPSSVCKYQFHFRPHGSSSRYPVFRFCAASDSCIRSRSPRDSRILSASEVVPAPSERIYAAKKTSERIYAAKNRPSQCCSSQPLSHPVGVSAKNIPAGSAETHFGLIASERTPPHLRDHRKFRRQPVWVDLEVHTSPNTMPRIRLVSPVRSSPTS
jgi:hypothetical protein